MGRISPVIIAEGTISFPYANVRIRCNDHHLSNDKEIPMDELLRKCLYACSTRSSSISYGSISILLSKK